MSLQNRRVRRNLPRPGHAYTTQRREFPDSLPSSRPNSANTEVSFIMGQPGQHNGYTPAPPPRPPSARSASRRASNIRPPSRETTSYNFYEGTEQKGGPDPYSRDGYSRSSSVALSRPSSSLSKYPPLPPIGHRQVSFESDIGDTGELTNSMRKLQVSVHVPSTETISPVDSNHSQQVLTMGINQLHNGAKYDTFTQRQSSRSDHIQTKDYSSTGIAKSEIPVVIPNSHKVECSSPRTSGDGQCSLSLAIKLPDGQRFQHSFPVSTSLNSVLRHVETESGQRLDGFSLIQNSPKKVFSDLAQTLAECQLEDRTLLYVDKDD